jgi:hypothetical protein|tara:strand:+ start:450 stop:551 length:102 start_codon:yes stop_codon:yes gene_type:complete
MEKLFGEGEKNKHVVEREKVRAGRARQIDERKG